jgi:hypothetical protein
MLDRFFRDGTAPQRLRANPLGSHLDSFTTVVTQRGYARSTIRLQLWLLADLGRWLRRKALIRTSAASLRVSIVVPRSRRS